MLSISKYYIYEGELPPIPTPEEFLNGADYHDRGPEIPEDVRREAEASAKQLASDDVDRNAAIWANQNFARLNAAAYPNKPAQREFNMPPIPSPEEFGFGSRYMAHSSPRY